jgi:hypothetical protein
MAFQALRENSIGPLTAGIPTAADLEWTIAKVEEDAPEEAKSSRANLDRTGGAAQVTDRNRERVLLGFTEARATSARFVDWATAEFVGIDLDRTNTKERYGYESADIWFSVRSGDKTYDFLLTKCVGLPDGWKTAGGLRFHPSEPGALGDPKTRMVHAHLSQVDSAIRMYYVVHRELPTSLETLLETDPHSGVAFLQTLPNDPWKQPIEYEVIDAQRFRLRSAGPDGESGTDDDLVWPREDDDGATEKDDG